MKYKLLILTVVSLLFSFSCSQEDQSINLPVREIHLDNGMTILLLNRPGAPVFAAETRVKVGSIEEEPGSFGLAHYFEHMAFKGTSKIGTKDWGREKELLDQVLALGEKIVLMKQKGATPEELKPLIEKRLALEKEQDQVIEKSEFTKIFQRHGGSNLNASTTNDATNYYVSLPSNKLELWAYMESERFIDPVLREFFAEKQVVAEERRSRIDNTPGGRLFEAFMDKAFDESPYKVIVIGPMEDIQNFTPTAAKEFYAKYYIPARMVVSVVGHFDLDEAEAVVRKYFGRIPKKENPPYVEEQAFKRDVKSFPREVTVTGPEKSRFYLGYHRPAHPAPVDITFDAIQSILCNGRTSRLFKRLVLEKRVASYVTCLTTLPGERLDSLFTFYGVPVGEHTNADVKKELLAVVEEFAKQGPTERELQKFVNEVNADLIYSLQSNSGMAGRLAYFQGLTGDWRYIYKLQDRIKSITADEIKQAVKMYFVPQNEVTGYFEQEAVQ